MTLASSADAFNVADAQLPQLATVPIDLPACPAGTSVAARLNVLTGVAGFVRLGISSSSGPIRGYGIAESTIVKGNFIAARAAWCPEEVADGASAHPAPSCQQPRWRLPPGERSVSLTVVGSDASLFAIYLTCEK